MKRKATAHPDTAGAEPARSEQPDLPEPPAPPAPPEHPELSEEPGAAAVAPQPVGGTPAGVVVRLTADDSMQGFEQLKALIPSGAEALWRALLAAPVGLRAVEAGRCGPADDAPAVDVPAAFTLLARLWAWQAIALASAAESPALEIRPAAPDGTLDLGVRNLQGAWRATRFAALRHERDASGAAAVFIEDPRSTISTLVGTAHAPRVAALFAQLLVPCDAAAMGDAGAATEAGGGTAELLYLLAVAHVIAPVDEKGRLFEDMHATPRQWEHHDLLFHFRSRQGRHRHAMGAGFRFKGVLEPQPACKPNPWRARAVALARPDLSQLASQDPPFTAVVEARRSIRAHDAARPISARQIGEFLFRSARVRGLQQTEIGELTSRPYPSGGASYELEIYLSVNQSTDLARGFYYYDPQAHSLSLVCPPNADMEALLDEAWISAARTCRPQVLVTLASRFQRVSWKYDGMAYAAQLKNVGVLYQTFYLVATAMNLAGCALGLGNADRFNRLSETDYMVESSVGEFMLGVPSLNG